jgi:methionyl-tRNA formyltransferase
VRYTLKYIRNLISGSGIAKVLTENDIPVRRLQVNINSVESLNLIRSFNPDLIISIAANQVFKRPLIELPPKGVINLHTALEKR